jgi:putative lipoic acid-binding regulatory protein
MAGLVISSPSVDRQVKLQTPHIYTSHASSTGAFASRTISIRQYSICFQQENKYVELLHADHSDFDLWTGHLCSAGRGSFL